MIFSPIKCRREKYPSQFRRAHSDVGLNGLSCPINSPKKSQNIQLIIIYNKEQEWILPLEKLEPVNESGSSNSTINKTDLSPLNLRVQIVTQVILKIPNK